MIQSVGPNSEEVILGVFEALFVLFRVNMGCFYLFKLNKDNIVANLLVKDSCALFLKHNSVQWMEKGIFVFY